MRKGSCTPTSLSIVSKDFKMLANCFPQLLQVQVYLTGLGISKGTRWCFSFTNGSAYTLCKWLVLWAKGRWRAGSHIQQWQVQIGCEASKECCISIAKGTIWEIMTGYAWRRQTAPSKRCLASWASAERTWQPRNWQVHLKQASNLVWPTTARRRQHL